VFRYHIAISVPKPGDVVNKDIEISLGSFLLEVPNPYDIVRIQMSFFDNLNELYHWLYIVYDEKEIPS
jgi:hypothetical protein